MLKKAIILCICIVVSGQLFSQRNIALNQPTLSNTGRAISNKYVLDLSTTFFQSAYDEIKQKTSLKHIKFENSDTSNNLFGLDPVQANSIIVLELENVSKRDMRQVLKLFDRCYEISTLKLKNVKLTNMPQAFINEKKIKNILIEDCKTINPSSLTEQLRFDHSITKIQLRNCGLYDIGKIDFPPSLRIIDLRDNRISSAGLKLSNCKQLDSVFISGNYIPDAYNDHLNFKNNNIKFIETDSISASANNKLRTELDKITWVFRGNDAAKDSEIKTYYGQFKVNNSSFNVYSNAYLYYNRVFSSRNLRFRFDTMSMDERFWDTSTVNEPIWRFGSRGTRVDVRRFRLYKEKTLVRKHITFGFNKHYSKIEELTTTPLFSRNDFFRQYPEMAIYRKYNWITNKPLSNRKFRALNKTIFVDMRIVYNDADKLFTIYLKHINGRITSFEAYPVKNNLKKDLTKFYVSEYNKYMAGLRKRAMVYNRNAKKEKRRMKTALAQSNRVAWNTLRSYMSPEERELSEEEWLKYYYKLLTFEKEALRSSYPDQPYLTRMFELSNYENRRRTSSDTAMIQSLYTYFTDDKGLNLPINKLIIIDKTNYSFTTRYFTVTIDPLSFTILRDVNMAMLVFLPDGSVGLVKEQAVNDFLDNNNAQGIKTLVIPKELITVGQILDELGL